MDTAGCFNDTLAAITWDRIAIFLPHLRNEIYPPKFPIEMEHSNPATSSQSLPIQQVEASVSEEQSETSTPPTSTFSQQQTVPQNQVIVQHPQPLPQSVQILPPPTLQSQISHSPPTTYVSMENQPSYIKYPFAKTSAIPGSSVIAPTTESITMNVPFSVPNSAHAYFPQPSQSYPWPAPSESKGYSQNI